MPMLYAFQFFILMERSFSLSPPNSFYYINSPVYLIFFYLKYISAFNFDVSVCGNSFIPSCTIKLLCLYLQSLLLWSFKLKKSTPDAWIKKDVGVCVCVCVWLLFSCSVMSDSLWPLRLQHTRLPVLHSLPEFAHIHVHWVGDAIQPSHPLLSPSPPALSLSQHQGLSQWVGSSHQVAKVLELQLQHQSFQWIFRVDLL